MSLLEQLEKSPTALPEEEVFIDSWGRSVTLRGMTSRERDLFEEESMRLVNQNSGATPSKQSRVEANLKNFRARLVSRHIVEGGMKTFANRRGESILGEQPAKVLEKLFTVSQRLSGFSQSDVEDLAKNFEETPENGLSTDSLGSQDGPSLN